MVVVPEPTAVARPALLTVATPGLVELHTTVFVTSCVLPLVYVPVAMNCCVLPITTEALAGVTPIDTNAGSVTNRLEEPLIEPRVATIVVLPWATVVASPALLMVATPGAEELQVTVPVRS